MPLYGVASQLLTGSRAQGSLLFNAGASSLIDMFNTTDETNYEKARFAWVSNVFTIQSLKGGTGTARVMDLLHNDSSGLRINGNATTLLVGSSGGFAGLAASADAVGIFIQGKTTSSTTVPGITLQNQPASAANSYNAASGSQTHLSVVANINQSGSAGYSALKVAMTETSTGSAGKLLLELYAGAAGTTRRFAIDNNGRIINANAANEAATATAGAAGAPPAQVVGYWIITDSGGTARKVAYYAN